MKRQEDIAKIVIGGATKVYEALGTGLPMETYLRALSVEMIYEGLRFEREKTLDII